MVGGEKFSNIASQENCNTYYDRFFWRCLQFFIFAVRWLQPTAIKPTAN